MPVHSRSSTTSNAVAAKSNPPDAEPQRTSLALARFMLDATFTPRLRRLLKASSRLILIKTADEATADLLDRYLSDGDTTAKVEALTEPHRTGGRLEPRGRSELSVLEHGRSVILISQDLERVIVPEALAGADAVITVPPPDLNVIRKTIRAVTGKTARDLSVADVTGLTLNDVVTAIRPGLRPRDCVANLRRASLFRQEPPQHSPVVPLDQLAMTSAVANWAFQTLRLMEQLGEKKVTAAALRYACLEGPSGTGKTTVAASLAHSAGWAFVSTSAGEWFANSGGHLGDVIRAARRFFDELALAKGPVVGLVDEIESLPARATMDPETSSWWTPVVTFVLTEIDRLRKSGRPVLLLGATNHFDRLDSALIRPSRIEKRISFLLPDLEERQRMFANCLGNRIGGNVFSILARLAVRSTPAQIESWCQSAIAAAVAENRRVEMNDLVGLIAPQNGRSPQKDRVIAIHETGHAIVAHELGLPVAEISILSVGDVGGWVNTRLENGLLTRGDVERMAMMMLGGRAADAVIGGGANAGAISDIDSVNRLLRTAMLDMGLYGSLTNAANADLQDWSQGLSLAKAISIELGRLSDQAVEIVERRRDDILNLAEILLLERVVTGDRLAKIIGGSAPIGGADGPAQLMGRV